MTLIESIWFLVSFLLILITLIVDPKEVLNVTNQNSSIDASSNYGSEQPLIMNFTMGLVLCFLVLTILLNLKEIVY